MASDLERLSNAYAALYEAQQAPIQAAQRASDTDWTSSAMKGAAMGSMFSPVGAAVGAIAGAGLGMFKAYNTRRKEGRSAWDSFLGTVGDVSPITDGRFVDTAMQAAPTLAMNLRSGGIAGKGLGGEPAAGQAARTARPHTAGSIRTKAPTLSAEDYRGIMGYGSRSARPSFYGV
jgi:hypothetical protein